MTFRTLSLAAATLALVATAVPANAYAFAETSRARSTVNYSDLDISGMPGAAALLARIKAAARIVCGPESEYSDIWERRAFQDCVAASIERAVAGVNSPLVSSLYLKNQTPMSVAQDD
jgi:UrcA family protein